jgi:DNA-binding NtrC family response regulator
MSSAIKPPMMVENPLQAFRLLVVSKEPAVVRSLAENSRWQAEIVSSGWDAMERLESGATPQLLLLDLPSGDGDSLHLLRWLRRISPQLSVVVICDAEDVRLRQEAVRLGAERILSRPLDARQIRSLMRGHGDGAEREAAETVSEHVEQIGQDAFFVSASPLMQKLRAQAELLAPTDVPVFIVGERGSGKSALARLMHELSVRSGFRFHKINCAALPEDLLQEQWFATGRIFGERGNSGSAHGRNTEGGSGERGDRGTIFFEEITSLPPGLQTKLLAALHQFEAARNIGLQSPHAEPARPAEVRILSSTSDHLERALAEHRLNPDLYRRLSAFTLQVPALRQRREEIPILMRCAMRKLAGHYGLASREFSPALLDACQHYEWPGNLTELESFVKRYLAGGEPELPALAGPAWAGVGPGDGDVPGKANGDAEPDNGSNRKTAIPVPQSLKSMIQDIKCDAERKAIGAALERTGWNRKAAARLLRVSYRTLLYKIEQYQMKMADPLFSVTPVGNVAARENSAKPDGEAS